MLNIIVMQSSFLIRYVSGMFRNCTICAICMMILTGCLSESPISRPSTVSNNPEQPVQQITNNENTPQKKTERETEKQLVDDNVPASDTVLSKQNKSQIVSSPPKPNVDTAKQWKEALEEVEELKRYRPLFIKPTPVDELLSWVPKGKRVRLFDEECRPVRVKRDEGGLTGAMDVETRISGGVKWVYSKMGYFGLFVSYTGPSSNSYIKNKKGKWVRYAGIGTCYWEERAGALNRVTKNSAIYGGAVVNLKAVCRAYHLKGEICAVGGKRTCRTCRSIRIQADSRSHGIGFGEIEMPKESLSLCLRKVDCSKPCPEDVLGEKIAKLNGFLKGKEFVGLDMIVEAPPMLFRTLKACRLHRARSNQKRQNLRN